MDSGAADSQFVGELSLATFVQTGFYQYCFSNPEMLIGASPQAFEVVGSAGQSLERCLACRLLRP